MSGKAMKKIRKHLRQELQGSTRIEAKWRFPCSFDPHFVIRPWQFVLFGKFKVDIPFLKLAMPKRGWFEIKEFPKHQFKFKYRFVSEANMRGKTIPLRKG